MLTRFRDSVQFSLESIYDASAERKQVEEALHESEKQVRCKLDAILSPEANISEEMVLLKKDESEMENVINDIRKIVMGRIPRQKR